MVDFAKATEEARRIRAECIFVGYCRICDTQSKIYEENIIKLDNDNHLRDLFKCPRCNACTERDELIPF